MDVMIPTLTKRIVGSLHYLLKDWLGVTGRTFILAASALTDDDNVTVDRYPVDGVFPWQGDDPDDEGVWLIGGAPDDVDALLDSLEQDAPENPAAD